ncbi:MAG: Branched-chain amino acid transport ATP-binding protein LivG [uncultured Ramlibacter sp.]|uniref:Branched-chain amino acid transport ATP-binding protein LivG n=1 Tax=uncultured Ramlibacter sp. TaxID=260755 RepID=A0A6J4PYF9_9BURK|nr:MAG: Branched-chain amino acid transport ATP-binding protein LivG [uncultured Ramlibacter sp.]
MNGHAVLELQGLHKRFGGVAATDGVDLRVAAGEIHALIGPNGAGKTTLIGQVSGQLSSDSGRVTFDGIDITRLPMHQRSRRGLARSFQITRLFRSMSVLENMAVAVQAAQGRTFSAWRRLRADTQLFDRAAAMLARLNLADKKDWRTEQLSHGEQRALEVGMALAGQPKLVLLDEPLAGMGAQESEAMTALVAGLRQEFAVLLVEHDVDAVFRLADTVSVLVNGRIIASGKPQDVRRDPAVAAAYLGTAEGEAR